MLNSEGYPRCRCFGHVPSSLLLLHISPPTAPFIAVRAKRSLAQGYPLHFSLFHPSDPATGSPTATLLRLVSDLEPCTHSLVARSRLTPFSITTGGVYKEQGRIHRVLMSPRLLAIPRSWASSKAHSLSITINSIFPFLVTTVVRVQPRPSKGITDLFLTLPSCALKHLSCAQGSHYFPDLTQRSPHLSLTAMHHSPAYRVPHSSGRRAW